MKLEIRNLWKSYGEKCVLHGFSAEIPLGETTVIMGPSGCGKTTLLGILLGFVSPDNGTITGMPSKKAAVFQEDRLCSDFSALSNVKLVMSRGDPLRAKELLCALGLEGDMNKPVRELSGGMQRRVAIARALAYDSELVVLDEPFKGLDEITKASVMDVVRHYTAGKTVIAVTHDPEEAAYLGGKIIKMEASK